jgi:hypothetical protein
MMAEAITWWVIGVLACVVCIAGAAWALGEVLELMERLDEGSEE